jgi:hypothetical protein
VRPTAQGHQGRRRKGANSRVGDRRELEEKRTSGARGRETVESSRARDRLEADGRSVGSDASGTPTIARERGRWEVRGARYGGVRPVKPGGSSSTAGLPLDGEDFSFDFRCRDLNFEESNCRGFFFAKTHLFCARVI